MLGCYYIVSSDGVLYVVQSTQAERVIINRQIKIKHTVNRLSRKYEKWIVLGVWKYGYTKYTSLAELTDTHDEVASL